MEKRSPNFTSIEVNFLLEAVKKYKSVIENKKTDRVCAEEKINAWKNVEREFNSTFTHTFRSHKVLKTKYGNIKATAKQNFASDKRQTYATGGGPPHQSVTTKTDQTILEICQEAQILGKQSIYDCDADENEFTDIDFVDECYKSDSENGAVGGKLEQENVEIKKESDPAISWEKYTPTMLKKPVHKKLKHKKSTKDSWANVAEAKLERQKLEMEMLQQKHNLEMEKLQLEIDFIKMKMEHFKTTSP